MKKILTPLCMTLLAFGGPVAVLNNDALAQDDFMSRIPPEGAVILNLSASETMTLEQDQLNASLRAEVTDKDAKVVQNKINDVMGKALKKAKAVDAVKTSTGSYNVYQNYRPVTKDGEKTVEEWRGQQTIDLVSTDKEALLDLVTELQDQGLIINNLNYTLSDKKQESVRDELMTKALKKLQTRAEVAGKALGKSSIQFIEINTDGGFMPPQPVPMMARMEMAGAAADMKQAVAEAGESDIAMTVTARILLKP
ncbi:MAG: SIMPL domain-containing protein [Pseudobdellovibrionaceae bacterium]